MRMVAGMRRCFKFSEGIKMANPAPTYSLIDFFGNVLEKSSDYDAARDRAAELTTLLDTEIFVIESD